MWSHYLKILISFGLLLSFLLVSCSDDKATSKGSDENSGNAKTGSASENNTSAKTTENQSSKKTTNVNNTKLTDEQFNYVLKSCKISYNLFQCIKKNQIEFAENIFEVCKTAFDAGKKHVASVTESSLKSFSESMSRHYPSVLAEADLILKQQDKCNYEAGKPSIKCYMQSTERIIKVWKKHVGIDCSL